MIFCESTQFCSDGDRNEEFRFIDIAFWWRIVYFVSIQNDLCNLINLVSQVSGAPLEILIISTSLTIHDNTMLQTQTGR